MELPRGVSRIMEVSDKSSAADLDRVGTTLATAKNQIREALQDLTGAQMEAIIKKLEDGEPLAPEEKDYVRAWIIGDAESYTRMGNRFQTWLREFKDLQSAVQSYEGREVTVQNLSNLHAILEDAVRVAADIEDFLEKRERIERFNKTIQNIDSEDTSFIVDILKGQLRSEEV